MITATIPLALNALDVELEKIENIRNKTLRTFRLKCKHLRLAEIQSQPPYRICINCGATEVGWHCGYQVLTLQCEKTYKVPPRAIVYPNASRDNIEVLRWDWPLYLVGQSHDNFSEKRDYKSLTAIEKQDAY